MSKNKGVVRLVVFDIDGTLTVERSSWRFLHERLGTWGAGRLNRERFLRGEIGYEEWARLDASLWRGVQMSRVQKLFDVVAYMKGAKKTIEALRRSGVKVALLSAGLSQLAERINREVGVDFYMANELEEQEGFLTGEVRVNLSVDGKHHALERVLSRFAVRADECAAVGDDETMIPIFRQVGRSIAFNTVKRVVRENADVVVEGKDLRRILPYLQPSP